MTKESAAKYLIQEALETAEEVGSSYGVEKLESILHQIESQAHITETQLREVKRIHQEITRHQ